MRPVSYLDHLAHHPYHKFCIKYFIDQSINLRSRVGLGPHISHGIHCKFNFSSLEKTPFPLRPQIFILRLLSKFLPQTLLFFCILSTSIQ